jgi:hypothetical protein
MGFRLSGGHGRVYNAADIVGCASRKLAAPATADDHRRAGLRDRPQGRLWRTQRRGPFAVQGCQHLLSAAVATSRKVAEGVD